MSKIYLVSNTEKGITRTIKRKVFCYHSSSGKQITAIKSIERIKMLKIPPAYVDVWICKSPHGHIQAYGYDTKNRKQYIYHSAWREQQEKSKFEHLLTFGKALGKIRRKVRNQLKLKKLTKEKVAASAINMLDKTSMRIGSPQYDSYGLLTIRKKHIKVKGATLIFDFEGKSKQHWHLELYDKEMSVLIRRFEKYPGYTIFKYFDIKNNLHPLKVADINDYLKKITGHTITAKEFRTWKGSLYYLHYLLKYKKKNTPVIQKLCIEKVAKKLNNTPKVCKSSYIHPLLFQENLVQTLNGLRPFQSSPTDQLSIEERKLIALLKKFSKVKKVS